MYFIFIITEIALVSCEFFFFFVFFFLLVFFYFYYLVVVAFAAAVSVVVDEYIKLLFKPLLYVSVCKMFDHMCVCLCVSECVCVNRFLCTFQGLIFFAFYSLGLSIRTICVYVSISFAWIMNKMMKNISVFAMSVTSLNDFSDRTSAPDRLC